MLGGPLHKLKHARQKNAHVDRARAAFNRFFSGPDIWASDALWRGFQHWRGQRHNEDFVEFKKALLAAKEEARTQMDAWANPFVNAKKDEPYEISFILPECVSKFNIFGLEKIGLKLEISGPRTGCIYGTPTKAGDFLFSLAYIWKGRLNNNEHLIRHITLTVNPNPQELWQNIPSDCSIEYWRPDTKFEAVKMDNGLLTGVSQRGRSHAHTGQPRDDAFGLACADGWGLLAVADGAGSAAFSRRGAELACNTGLDNCRLKLTSTPELNDIFANLQPDTPENSWLPQARKLAYGILPNAAFEVHKAIYNEALITGRDAKVYATTLLMALAKKFAHGWAVLAFQIGDGAMALLEPDAAKLLIEPDEGDYGGQTRFVTMSDIFESHELMRRLYVAFVANLQGLLLVTDGISDPRFGSLANLHSSTAWHELWNELKPLATGTEPKASLLEWSEFWARGSHDDRTLAMFIAGA